MKLVALRKCVVLSAVFFLSIFTHTLPLLAESPRKAYLIADVNESYKGQIIIQSEIAALRESGLRQTDLIDNNLFFCGRNANDDLELRTYSYATKQSVLLWSGSRDTKYIGVYRSRGYLVFAFNVESTKALSFILVAPNNTPSVIQGGIYPVVSSVTDFHANENFICARTSAGLHCFWDRPNQSSIVNGQTIPIAVPAGEEARIVSDIQLHDEEFRFLIEYRKTQVYGDGRYVVVRNATQIDIALAYDGSIYPNGGPLVAHLNGRYYLSLWSPNQAVQNAFHLISIDEFGQDVRHYNHVFDGKIESIVNGNDNNSTVFISAPNMLSIIPFKNDFELQLHYKASWSGANLKLLAANAQEFVMSASTFIEKRSSTYPYDLIERIDNILPGTTQLDKTTNLIVYLRSTQSGPELVRKPLNGTAPSLVAALQGVPRELNVSNGHYAIAGSEGTYEGVLWSFQPTVNSLQRIFKYGGNSESSSPRSLVVYNNRLYFIANVRVAGQMRDVIASSDGNAGQFTIEKMVPFGSTLKDLFLYNNSLHYELSIANQGGGSTFQLWKDVLATPQLLWQQSLNVNQSLYGRQIAKNGILYLLPISAGTIQYQTDVWSVGSTAQKISQGYIVQPFSALASGVPETVYLSYVNSAGGTGIYRSDGQAAPTLVNALGSYESAAFMVDDNLFINKFAIENSQLSWKLIRRDAQLNDFNVGALSGPLVFKADFGSQLLVATQREVYKVNPLTWELSLLAQFSGDEILSGFSSVEMSSRRFFATNIYQSTTFKESRLWVTDGTVEGTNLVRSFTTPQATNGIGALNSNFYFAGNNVQYGTELWSSDGTNAGTALVDDIWLGDVSSIPTDFVMFKDTAYFSASDSSNGRELWALDRCPSDQFKFEPGVCGCGTSDQDNDGDSIKDCFDLCPNDAQKNSPGICGCGIADVDANANGVSDCKETAVKPTPTPVTPLVTPTPEINPQDNAETFIIPAPSIKRKNGKLDLVLILPKNVTAQVVIKKLGSKPTTRTKNISKALVNLLKFKRGKWSVSYSYMVGNDTYQSKNKKFTLK